MPDSHLVVARLLDSGCDVRVLARHGRPVPRGATFFTADLRGGQGIEPAVSGSAAIIHCATSIRGDAQATGNLVAAASRAGAAHLVYVSIAGIDRIASWGYPKAKLQAEQIVAGSGLPWTILRVTQFYDYCLASARKLSLLPVAPVPAGFTVQPVDPRDMAGRLAGLALGEHAGRAPDMAGPQVSSWTDLLKGYRAPGQSAAVPCRRHRDTPPAPAPGSSSSPPSCDSGPPKRLARSAGRPRYLPSRPVSRRQRKDHWKCKPE